MTDEELHNFADWGGGIDVETKYGWRLLRKANPQSVKDQAALKDTVRNTPELSWKKDRTTERWILCWWKEIDGPTPIESERKNERWTPEEDIPF